ncbi:MAG: hypothetical protein WKG01_29330 [Kofleriaceae bacterium]
MTSIWAPPNTPSNRSAKFSGSVWVQAGGSTHVILGLIVPNAVALIRGRRAASASSIRAAAAAASPVAIRTRGPATVFAST